MGRLYDEARHSRPGRLPRPGWVMRFRAQRSFVYPLVATGEELASPPLEQVARSQVALGERSVVRFQCGRRRRGLRRPPAASIGAMRASWCASFTGQTYRLPQHDPGWSTHHLARQAQRVGPYPETIQPASPPAATNGHDSHKGKCGECGSRETAVEREYLLLPYAEKDHAKAARRALGPPPANSGTSPPAPIPNHSPDGGHSNPPTRPEQHDDGKRGCDPRVAVRPTRQQQRVRRRGKRSGGRPCPAGGRAAGRVQARPERTQKRCKQPA